METETYALDFLVEHLEEVLLAAGDLPGKKGGVEKWIYLVAGIKNAK